MQQMPLIYIVDDEPNIRRLVAFGLKDSGFDSREFPDGTQLLTAVRRRAPDAIVLDWMMPDPDGLEVCRRLRADPATCGVPILLLTARGTELDKVLGLEIGADDYITKPFGMKELCARVRAVLRRSKRQQEPAGETLEQGGLRVDVVRHTVERDGKTIALTAKEFDLLVMLMRNAGRVMTRGALLDTVWGVEYFGDTRTVDVHMRYLRQKVEQNPESPAVLLTVRGVGYKFAEGG